MFDNIYSIISIIVAVYAMVFYAPTINFESLMFVALFLMLAAIRIRQTERKS